MKISDGFDGSSDAFEGDRMLLVRSLPANARVTKASVTVTPAASRGGALFEETIIFGKDSQGDLGATKATGADFVEVDFHKRRTFAVVQGSNLLNTNLQVDIGGLYIEINNKGAVKAPNDPLFAVPNDGKLPGLTSSKFKLTRPASSPGPVDLSKVTIRSVPTNVSLRLGTMPAFWTRLGEITQTETSPDFAPVLQAFLANANVENGFYSVPLVLHSDSVTRLSVALEIDFSVEQSVLPDGVNESVLPFDFSGVSKTQDVLPQNAQLLALKVPANSRVAKRGISGRVTGAFEETRVLYPLPLSVLPKESGKAVLNVAPASSYAQPIRLTSSAVTATAVDLLLKVQQSGGIQLDVRGDVDGKPDNVSLFPSTLQFELVGAAGSQATGAGVSKASWISVQLPALFQFQTEKRYWLVLQSVEGVAGWSIGPATKGDIGTQRTQDGGLSWRNATATEFPGPLSTFFRLRGRPDRFTMPIEIEVGNADSANGVAPERVKLDRFEPLGRVDFTLDFDELADGFNRFLANAAPAICPEAEHLVNGTFEKWFRIGNELVPPVTIRLNASPRALAIGLDGSRAYVAGLRHSDNGPGVLQFIDVFCAKVVEDQELALKTAPKSIALNPDGTRAYVAGDKELQVVDLNIPANLGEPFPLPGEILSVVSSSDGTLLYAAVNPAVDQTSTTAKSEIQIIDTAKLEGFVTVGKPSAKEVTLASIDLGASSTGTKLEVAPDGSRLFATVTPEGGLGSELQVFDTTTLEQSLDPVSIPNGTGEIALTPNGKRALLADADGIGVVDTSTKVIITSIKIGGKPVSIGVSDDGSRAFVARQDDKLTVIDLTRLTLSGQPIVVGKSPTAVALSPTGDRVLVANAGDESLSSIQVGAKLPESWNLTSGQVIPVCAPQPLGMVAVLGSVEKGSPQTALPTGLSQVVPVAESCLYELRFRGIATEAFATAEVVWLGRDCKILHAEPPVPIQVVATHREQRIGESMTAPATGSAAKLLPVHFARTSAPKGASQAEIRFNVSAGVLAAVTNVSFAATTEALVNADFSLREGKGLAGWILLSGASPSVSLLGIDDGILVRNAGIETVELMQTLPAKADQFFTLELEARVMRSSTLANPSVELRWLKDGLNIGTPTKIEVAPEGLAVSKANGTSPEADEAEIHLLVPPGTTQVVKRVSLKFTPIVTVPLTFIAQAPGELTVSGLRVAVEEAEVQPPPIPDTGLCMPTPSAQGTDEKCCEPNGDGKCFCSCCGTSERMKNATAMETEAGRPVVVGHCATCGAELVRFGGQRVPGAPRFALRSEPVNSPIVLTQTEKRFPQTTEVLTVAERAKVNAERALQDIEGIGPARAKRLLAAGVDSAKLAETPVDIIVELLKPGMSADMAAKLVEAARERLRLG
jgi:DNA-binding beta-propeller fold protein YncE